MIYPLFTIGIITRILIIPGFKSEQPGIPHHLASNLIIGPYNRIPLFVYNLQPDLCNPFLRRNYYRDNFLYP